MGTKFQKYNISDFQKISINCHIFNISIISSSNHDIELSWKDTVMRTLEIEKTEGILSITDRASVGIYGTLALINLKKDATLLVKIPSSFSGNLILQTKNDKLYVADINITGNIGVSSDSGEILLENICANTLDVRGNIGKINCYSVSVEHQLNISARTSSINCIINGIPDDYSVYCESQNHRSSYPQNLTTGPHKVSVINKTGIVRIQFQNNSTIKKQHSYYNRHDSFKDW
ncbi:MAG: DUF4097 family beta strand repeat-containing protein [Lachnospiraceae bacterium]|nr:DUF4097 family beta strand repeat-containing protein [Lachnospiraceae bacterium]MDD3617114.1 DUF4097 family beta strand repeat-containing protein [Lachnospiraceae bacterium]